MKPDVKARWVEALRSGRYTQARGALRDAAGGHCCLGVLADIAGIDWSTQTKAEPYGDVFFVGLEGDRLYERCGLGPSSKPAQLARMNDGVEPGRDAPASFAEIADWIEANL